MLLSQPWIAELMTENLETGRREEAPQAVWEAAAAACDLSDVQVALYGVMHDWWSRCGAALLTVRRNLASQALAAPGDLALQGAVVEALAEVNGRYLSQAAAALVCGVAGILRERTADLWVTCLCYGHLPVMTALLDAMRRHQRQRRAAAAAAAAATAASGNANGASA